MRATREVIRKTRDPRTVRTIPDLPDGIADFPELVTVVNDRLRLIADLDSGHGGAGPYVRTLVLKDTAVRDDTADHVPIYTAGRAFRVIGVLRKVITADLT